MTGDRNASLLAVADALMNEHLDEFADDDGYEVGWRDSRYGVKVRDAIYDALASSSASGAEQMREAATNHLDHMARQFYGDDEHWAEAYEQAANDIRALPLPDPAPAWRDIASAPKDKPILAWCDHEADPYHLGDGKLTLYAGHAEGLSHAPTGLHIVEWGGAWDDNTHEYSGGWMPDWWFVAGSEFEVVANPIGWMPLPPPPQTDGGSVDA